MLHRQRPTPDQDAQLDTLDSASVAIWGAVDMGSSSCRAALVDITSEGVHLASEVTTIQTGSSKRRFAKAIQAALGETVGLGVSIAGPTDATSGSVLFAGAYTWAKGPLADKLAGHLGHPVTVLNDAEAHLCAHLSLGAHPMLCVALGTAVGFAATDDTGAIRRPRAESCWELGHVVLPAPAGDREEMKDRVTWALSGRGLDEQRNRAGDAEGRREFTARLATFIYNLSIVFQPRTVVLAGGVIAHNGDLTEAVNQSVSSMWPPAIRWDPPSILDSPHGSDSGLLGAAVAAARAANKKH